MPMIKELVCFSLLILFCGWFVQVNKKRLLQIATAFALRKFKTYCSYSNQLKIQLISLLMPFLLEVWLTAPAMTGSSLTASPPVICSSSFMFNSLVSVFIFLISLSFYFILFSVPVFHRGHMLIRRSHARWQQVRRKFIYSL